MPKAKVKALTRPSWSLTRILQALGCVFCPECFAYMYPDHTEHVARYDANVSRYVVVGPYGSTSLVAVDQPESAGEAVVLDETTGEEVSEKECRKNGILIGSDEELPPHIEMPPPFEEVAA